MVEVFAEVSILQLALIAAVALVASVVGGVAGYGTGALMPLVLVPIVGPEPVVPIIALSGLFTNTGRMAAFRSYVAWRPVRLVLIAAVPPCIVTAYGYTLLTSRGAALVIGTMLVLTVPLRRLLLRARGAGFGDRGLVLGGAGYGLAVGGTVGSGVILLSVLMASGLGGAAVVATDAAISLVIGAVRIAVFGMAGAFTMQTTAFALLIGIVALPGAFLARAFVERIPIRVHTALLDAIVLAGGAFMIGGALLR